ncbi:hypothetical protein GSI_03657 [Ganoderma sinense ZZ0214-1]|uniref:Uncharacterized protein n=1 Tax=Ganoderma sinense ZZ0214-1 TaxID=1077348 RepID=A0A2G8SJK6_9APHY|nr:hypothetical protein GSI_03657 [Ganoderma sinense ZZ0214-1]
MSNPAGNAATNTGQNAGAGPAVPAPAVTAAAFPSPSDRKAPKFKGKHVEDFIQEIDLLAALHSVPATELPKACVRYMSKKVKQIISAEPAFQGVDWDVACVRLRALFGSASGTHRCSPSKLRKFVDEWQRDNPINSEESLDDYWREFLWHLGTMAIAVNAISDSDSEDSGHARSRHRHHKGKRKVSPRKSSSSESSSSSSSSSDSDSDSESSSSSDSDSDSDHERLSRKHASKKTRTKSLSRKKKHRPSRSRMDSHSDSDLSTLRRDMEKRFKILQRDLRSQAAIMSQPANHHNLRLRSLPLSLHPLISHILLLKLITSLTLFHRKELINFLPTPM